MASLNIVHIIGMAGKDPETKCSPSGTQISRFSVATSEKVKKNDTWEDKTEWHNMVCFGKIAELADKYLKKGSQVYIEGKIQTSSWSGEDGVKKYKTEIMVNRLQFLSKKDSSGGQEQGQAEQASGSGVEDDLPF